MTERYSPKPVAEYRGAAASAILSSDEQAWNLAWLSYDFDSNRFHPDPNFGVYVRRTLMYVPMTGETDITGKMPDRLTIRGILNNTPPRVALELLRLPQRERLPLFKAYGPGWLVTVEERSHLYRAPYNAAYDTEVSDFTQALQVLARFR